MNLLHHHHYHVYFQFRKRDSPNYVSLTSERARWLRMRCKSESESESDWDGGRGVAVAVAVAARDRKITFGKYKGKMLGSIPSRYLKWVSNNLRAGHFEEWAKLADQVLQDPIYRDRIEWELALNVLNGNNLNLKSSSSAVSQLLEISDRFGWDNRDKVGWSKVNFDLLGTSKGGRIPRRLVTHTLTQTDTHNHAQLQHKDPHRPTSTCLSIKLNNKSRTRRMQRRERQKNIRLKTQAQAQALHQHTENNKKNVNDINMDYHDDDDDDDDGRMMRQDQNQNAIANPFPGRQALLTNYHRTGTSTSKRFDVASSHYTYRIE